MVSKPIVDFSIDTVSGEVHITQVLQVSPPAPLSNTPYLLFAALSIHTDMLSETSTLLSYAKPVEHHTDHDTRVCGSVMSVVGCIIKLHVQAVLL